MNTPKATYDDVLQFIRAVYPDAPELAIASFSEKQVLNDAANLIVQMRLELSQAADAIHRKDRQLTNCDICDVRPGHRVMSASGVEGVICEECESVQP
jgi:hypothetical protein